MCPLEANTTALSTNLEIVLALAGDSTIISLSYFIFVLCFVFNVS